MSSTHPDIHQEKILILDFGSQYTQLIARRLRETGVYCEIHPYDLAEEKARELSPVAFVLSGGPESVTADDTLEQAVLAKRRELAQPKPRHFELVPVS